MFFKLSTDQWDLDPCREPLILWNSAVKSGTGAKELTRPAPPMTSIARLRSLRRITSASSSGTAAGWCFVYVYSCCE